MSSALGSCSSLSQIALLLVDKQSDDVFCVFTAIIWQSFAGSIFGMNVIWEREHPHMTSTLREEGSWPQKAHELKEVV